MHKKDLQNNWVKVSIGWAICLGLRLIPLRAPNIEPIMATMMPFAKGYGVLTGFIFSFTSIFLYDIMTSGIGDWTWVTALSYGALAMWASYYFKNRKSTSVNYLKFSLWGTLLYDFVTGVVAGPVLHGASYTEALMGQIPFTMLHLVGNLLLAAVVSPLIYRWVIENPNLEFTVLKQKLHKG